MGVGLGLRAEFLQDAEAALDGPSADSEAAGSGAGQTLAQRLAFLEVCPENYMGRGGRNRRIFDALVERIPSITHGVMMSLGGLDPFDLDYFASLRRFLAERKARWHSDHMCFSADGGAVLHDLLPLPLDEATARRFAARVREARDRLGVELAVENISYYLPMGVPQMSEAEFATMVCEEADCGLLLDVNNIYVNAKNHGFDAHEMLAGYPLDRVVQMHVAGHTHWPRFGFFLDDHGATVEPTVHEMMGWVVERTGPIPVLLERDKSIPSFEILLGEVAALQASYDRALARGGEHPDDDPGQSQSQSQSQVRRSEATHA